MDDSYSVVRIETEDEDAARALGYGAVETTERLENMRGVAGSCNKYGICRRRSCSASLQLSTGEILC